MAHIQLTAYYGARSFAASRASPCSQSAPSLHSFKGFFTNCSSFHRNSSRKWFTLCMLFILNKRCLRDTKTYSCKCSKSKNFEQVSFPMKESLLDTASCQTRRDNAIAKATRAERKVGGFYSIVQGEYYIFLHTPLYLRCSAMTWPGQSRQASTIGWSCLKVRSAPIYKQGRTSFCLAMENPVFCASHSNSNF